MNAERNALIRKCKLEEIDLALENGSLDDIPLESLDQTGGSDTMQIDSQNEICFDYSELPKEYQTTNSPAQKEKFINDIKELTLEIEKLAPNVRVLDR